ncbi:MAG: HAMP domain-containing histidine kinase [Proteobacteria bacterium]|nr:HAMP domain-containing histidine kinase [Pseudomonadota bacterium]
MRFSIFTRLATSYLLLFSMFAGVSLFFISHLNRFNQLMESIIHDDTVIMEISDKLSDLLLAESRYDRKFVVLKDVKLYENYLQAKTDFTTLLKKAQVETFSITSKESLNEIELKHTIFSQLIETEKSLILSAEPYPTEYYEDEKKKTANALISRLAQIRNESESGVFRKINNLREESINVSTIAVIITTISLLTGLLIAVIITRSIITPLNIMKAKTKEISMGNFAGDLHITSPPAIHELAVSINDMCHKLQAIDTIKSDFFSHMSHELRTPLTSIQQGTHLLIEGHGAKSPERQQKILGIIAHESERLIQMVNALLDLAKMEAGMLDYNYTATDMAALVKESLSTLMPLAEAKSITISNTVSNLPRLNVDQERIKQVFRNLIGNALKFTPQHGEIKIGAEVADEYVQFSVTDTGPGIPAAELERIFIKFQQVIPATGESIKGTGLGLATVRQIILAHGGKAWATSQEGSGSTFYISLPA